MRVNIQNLIDNDQCYKAVRDLRWPDVVTCSHCQSTEISKRGKDETEPYRQRYQCRSCNKRFDDLTNTVFAGHHQPLKTWIIFLYFMGLNLSTNQIAQELSINSSDAHFMAKVLRQGIVDKKPDVELSGAVECDEVYVIAGHKGNTEAVKKKEENQGEIG